MRSVRYLLAASIIVISIHFTSCKDDSTSPDNESQQAEETLEWNKKIAKEVIHTNAKMLSNGLKNISDEQQRIEFVRAAIDSVRFYDDASGYFYVYDYNCVNIAHCTQKDLQGQNLYDHQDTRGKYVIRELASASKAGGGFVEFYWVKPGTTGEKQKLGYVEPVPYTNYFIGTGVYLE